MAYRITNTVTKINDSDLWITVGTPDYFSSPEETAILQDYIQTINSITGITNQNINYEGNTLTITYDADSLNSLNAFDTAISGHQFIRLRNQKLRELNIAQYVYSKTITEI
jgi:hypothetical protein